MGARVGVSIYNVSTNELWDYKGNSRFPLMSTFKTLACAKLLADVDNVTTFTCLMSGTCFIKTSATLLVEGLDNGARFFKAIFNLLEQMKMQLLRLEAVQLVQVSGRKLPVFCLATGQSGDQQLVCFGGG